MESIIGRSYCPHCKNQVRWYDNIPLLSFVFLRARCRTCKGDISWQYPVVEFLSGIVFLLVAKFFLEIGNVSSYVEVFFYLVLFSSLLVLFTYDLKFMEVPIIIFWTTLVIVTTYFLYLGYTDLNNGVPFFSLNIVSGMIGGFVAWLFFFSLVFFSKETWMGWGDVYIGFLLGFILGWPNVFFGLLISFTVGALYAIIAMIVGEKNMKSQVPFVPFLVLGIIATIFINEIFPIVKYYFYF